MAEEVRSVGIDDIMAAAAAGVLRALESRRIGMKDTQISDLVAAGFSVEVSFRSGRIPSDTIPPIRRDTLNLPV